MRRVKQVSHSNSLQRQMMEQYPGAKVDGSFFVVVFLFFWTTSAGAPPPHKSEHNGLTDMNEEVVFSQAVLLSLSMLAEPPE